MVLQVADVYETIAASAGVREVATRTLEEAVLVSSDGDALTCPTVSERSPTRAPCVRRRTSVVDGDLLVVVPVPV